MRFTFALALLALPASLPASGEVPFESSNERFANAAACTARLGSIVAEARRRGDAAAQGPYEVGGGDVRVHAVAVSGSGHRITEHRCLGEQLSSRTWRHSMDEAEAEGAETIETMAAKAEWLKKKPRR